MPDKDYIKKLSRQAELLMYECVEINMTQVKGL